MLFVKGQHRFGSPRIKLQGVAERFDLLPNPNIISRRGSIFSLHWDPRETENVVNELMLLC